MNSNKLLSVLRDVRLLKFVSTDELQKLVNDYPYFQQAHLLLAKKYLTDNNSYFEEKLHLAAIYASDRKNLHTIMIGDKENAEKPEAIKIPAANVEMRIKEDELIHASMSDNLPAQDSFLEEENEELIADDNTITEAIAMEELEVASVPSERIEADELVHASMSDTLPVQDTLLEEENYEAVAEENTITEATAMEELEAAALPSEALKADELIHASMSDTLPIQDTLLEEENYEVLAEDNAITEATAMEELEAIAPQPAHTNGKAASENFNIDQPHTFSDWLKFIQSMPRSLQHKSSAPDYHPISVPEPAAPSHSTNETEAETEVETDVEVEIVHFEHIPDALVGEPTDNLEAIDQFVAKTTQQTQVLKTVPVKQLADKSLEESDELLTETLAKVYEEQGLYNKAIRVYAKLSLKFPEKSLYFAPLIKELKSKI